MSDISHKWVDILIPFTSNYGNKLGGAELSRLSGVPQQTSSRYLSQLVKRNVLSYERQGRNKLYYFDYSRHETRSILEIVENRKSLDFRRKLPKISVVIDDILENAESIIVFGSYSSFKFDKSSDLDIVVLGRHNRGRIRKAKKKHIIQINEHYISHNEFSRMLKSKNALSIEILKNHTIFGNVSEIVRIFTETVK